MNALCVLCYTTKYLLDLPIFRGLRFRRNLRNDKACNIFKLALCKQTERERQKKTLRFKNINSSKHHKACHDSTLEWRKNRRFEIFRPAIFALTVSSQFKFSKLKRFLFFCAFFYTLCLSAEKFIFSSATLLHKYHFVSQSSDSIACFALLYFFSSSGQ